MRSKSGALVRPAMLARSTRYFVTNRRVLIQRGREELLLDRSRIAYVIATPARAAQDVADRMVACGITSILNFAPIVLSVPPQVDIRKVDLSIELQILAYHEQRKTQGAQAATQEVTA